MPQCKLKSFLALPGRVQQGWYHVDATDQILGRLATRIATVLMGKHKPTYTPHVDTGDFVVVTNAEKVRVTGNKAWAMTYERYSYYPGGRKIIPFEQMKTRHPERIISEAVRRMLPKNALGRKMLTKLKVYVGDEHPHAAQQPAPFAFEF
jgi:large subunit ribosomal protein L13